MQKSRRALLHRRASGKIITGRNCVYKVSLSLVFVLWGLVLLSSLWISRSDGFRDESEPALQCAETNFVSKDISETEDDNVKALPCKGDIETEDSSISEISNNESGIGKRVGSENANPDKTPENGASGIPGLSRNAPGSLDEFKRKAFNSKPKADNDQLGSIKHRVEPSGKEYNYASASKGAKMLASNKESKGADNILSKDKDKYLRNPCSADDKFVVIELSEETLVDTVVLANFEHYSSNLKDFELLGSLIYPTDSWFELGNFTAGNVKHEQRFTLQDPKWVRYLKLKLLNHYGSEFYCTLSLVKIYGVDAVERMLEDLISAQNDVFLGGHKTNVQNPEILISMPRENDGGLDQNTFSDVDSDKMAENSGNKPDNVVSNVPDPVEEIRPQQNGRMPGDTVLKILMQKVRSFDVNLSVLERYLEELNSKYGSIFNEFDKEIETKDELLKKIKAEIDSFLESRNVMATELGELMSWKSHVTVQLDNLVKDNVLLRSELEKVRETQTSAENRGFAVFFIFLIFGILAVMMLFVDIVGRVYCFCFLRGKADEAYRTEDEKPRKFCYMNLSWFFLMFNCCIVMFIISL